MTDLASVPVPERWRGLRRYAVDGGLLLFDRDSGLNVLVESEATAGLQLAAPRAVQFAITNRCNLACHFCSRDQSAASAWTAESAFTLLAELAGHGVLEVAFGGGEPLAFPKITGLISRLHAETPLAVSLTTNGLLLNAARLRRLRGKYGQIRLSLYDDNDWPRTIRLLADEGARFGVNYLVTPPRLPDLEAVVLALAAAGCRDILLLSYNGRDPSLHLAPAEARALARGVAALAHGLAGRCELKLDVCWGERMEGVPRLFAKADCGAGREFLSVTSDRCVSPCSFHDVKLPFADAAELVTLWRREQAKLATPAPDPGCARLAAYGLAPGCRACP